MSENAVTDERLAEIREEFDGYSDDIKLGSVFGTPTVGEFKYLIRAALSSGWRTIETAPEDEHVILATEGGFVGEAIMLLNEDGSQKWAWALGAVHAAHTPLRWQPLPQHPAIIPPGEN